MLVLSRAPGEKIVLTGGITIVALGMRNGRLRIGIEAPDHISIDREEIDAAKKLGFINKRMLD